ncbi:MAG: hypothetical protein BGO76_00275 [Caedibacter sp. 38-128]|nr:phenylalanine--tRNA ligase subunit beta [Holosporales bacterium]OJX05021.1 MAG: hypothetical protein BGO76_00275 [Caedibacter sp. 38-128]
MKISIHELEKHIKILSDLDDLQNLMEDVGIEVKKIEEDGSDTIFTLEVLANRGDHYSYAGIAREIHGRTGWEISPYLIDDLPVKNNITTVTVETENCLSYTLTEFFLPNGQVSGTLNEEQKKVVVLSGSNLIIPVVDVTNYINASIGQPMHVFDADKVDGTIVIRETVHGEKARLLFSEDAVELPPGTIVVADRSNILAVAGVMGCEGCQATENTRRIYLESAIFNPVKIRKAARYLGVQSLSSMRFERGADPALVKQGIKQAAVILDSLGWRITDGIGLCKEWSYDLPQINISLSEVGNYFEMDVTIESIRNTLSRYGFGVRFLGMNDLVRIEVPSYRIWDIKEEADLREEIARSIGYNLLPSSMPEAIQPLLPSLHLERKKSVENILIGQGFYEVFTDGFYSEKHRSRLGIDESHPLWSHLRIINAEDRAYGLLKNNNLIQALDLVQTNINVKNPHIKAFEWTRTFHPNEQAENSLGEEKLVLWAIASGQYRKHSWNDSGKDVDIFDMKGIVEEISNALGIFLEIKQETKDNLILPVGTCLHPTRRASIVWGGKTIGVIGEVHPDVLDSWGIKNTRPCFMEIFQEILDVEASERIYIAPTNLLPVMRDVCILLPKELAASTVCKFMSEQSDWIESVKIQDVFNSEATGYKNAVTFSISYSLTKAGLDKFLTDDINDQTERIVEKTLRQFREYSIRRR